MAMHPLYTMLCRAGILLLAAGMPAGCKPATPAATNCANAEGNTEVTGGSCAATGLNGKWKLVKIKENGKAIAATPGETVVFTNCNKAEYYSAGGRTHADAFKLYKVIQYCADYQLVYAQDSISCINFRKDTLIIGACNDFETTKFLYKRME